MRFVIEFEDGSIGRVLNMYDENGRDTDNRLQVMSIVAQLPDGRVFPGEVFSYEGIHPVQ